MSTTGDGDLAPGGQEGPAGAAGAQAGARDGVDRNSEARIVWAAKQPLGNAFLNLKNGSCINHPHPHHQAFDPEGPAPTPQPMSPPAQPSSSQWAAWGPPGLLWKDPPARPREAPAGYVSDPTLCFTHQTGPLGPGCSSSQDGESPLQARFPLPVDSSWFGAPSPHMWERAADGERGQCLCLPGVSAGQPGLSVPSVSASH